MNDSFLVYFFAALSFIIFKANFIQFSKFLADYERFGTPKDMYSDLEDKTLMAWFERKNVG